MGKNQKTVNKNQRTLNMNEKVYKALNEQIKHEFYSAYLYLAMASYFDNVPLEGFYKWFRKQSDEEYSHGMKIYEYILERNCHVHLQPIEAPPADFNSIEEVFQMALDHEKKVTQLIHSLYDLAIEEGDHATRVFLHWF